MGILGQYKNGNYKVAILDDGTKIRLSKYDEFIPEFPENIDLKITNQCDRGCPWCHENSTADGAHADLNAPFIDTLRPFTELAIGGGNPLSHPDLVPFLERLKEKQIIANITVNQKHFMDNIDFIKELTDKNLIYGLGVSLEKVSPAFIEKAKQFKNLVVHVIVGLVTIDEMSILSKNGLKVLVLGYKIFRRGKGVYNPKLQKQINEAKEWIPELLNDFKVLSFDNLALEQLDMKSKVPKEVWMNYYMGDDGSHTMYIDLVRKEYAVNSTSTYRKDLEDDIVEMFKDVKDIKEMQEAFKND